MTTKNNITGDSIKTKHNTQSYKDGWDRIFSPKKNEDSILDDVMDTWHENAVSSSEAENAIRGWEESHK